MKTFYLISYLTLFVVWILYALWVPFNWAQTLFLAYCLGMIWYREYICFKLGLWKRNEK